MRLEIARKLLASFFKREWTLEDYPIESWRQWAGYNADNTTLEIHVARIATWHAMSGVGMSPEAALADLRRQFESYRRSNGAVPRPGRLVGDLVEPSAAAAPSHEDHLISGIIEIDRN